MPLEIERPHTKTDDKDDDKAVTSNVPGAKKVDYDPHHLTGLIADRNLYTTKDEAHVVEMGDAKAAFLLAAKGGNIPPGTVKKYGLTLEGDKVVVGKKEDGTPKVAPPATRPNEGQIDDGTPLVKVIRTGVLRTEPAPENPAVALEEELKGKNPEPGSAEAKAAKAPKAPAKKVTVVRTGATKAARKGKGR